MDSDSRGHERTPQERLASGVAPAVPKASIPRKVPGGSGSEARRSKGEAPSRLGIVVGKKVGKSHDRNKIRRRIRAIARLYWKEIAPGADLIVAARYPAARESFESLKSEFVHLAKKGGLWKP